MKIEKFIKAVDPVIFKRGEDYFENNRVEDLEYYNEDDSWDALVCGSEDYFVSIEFDGSDIEKYECDCPYEGGPVCKHVVATLLAISQKYSKSSLKKGKHKSRKKLIQEILKKISKKELIEFVEKHAEKQFMDSLFDNYCHLLKIAPETKYKQIIKGHINTGFIDNDFIDYYHASAAMSPIASLVTKAENLIKNDEFEEAVIICQTVIEEIAEIVEDIDDSDGWINSTVGDAFQLLMNIGEKSTSKTLKNNLFDYCFNEYKKERYEGYFEYDFIEAISYFSTDTKHSEKYLKLLSDLIDNSDSEYKTINLIKTKVDFLQKIGKVSEAEKLVEDNIKFTQFRKEVVEKEIKNKNYGRAVLLINEAIKLNSQNRHGNNWKDYLLKIAELKKDKDEVFKIAMEQFLSYYNFEYYSKLKKYCPKDQWKDEVDKILKHIIDKQGYGAATAVAQIYIKEKYWDRLLHLLDVNKSNLNFVDEYSRYLIKEYPDEILKIYRFALTRYAQNTGRNIYNEIARVLRKMKKIPGGNKVVNDLVSYFMSGYKNRPAMREIIGGIK